MANSTRIAALLHLAVPASGLLAGCLALQDEPLRGEGEMCKSHSWCDFAGQNLICLRPYEDDYTEGLCAPLGNCFLHSQCPAGTHCEGMDTSAGVVGACRADVCTLDAQCGAGNVCDFGLCWTDCTESSSVCGTGTICVSRECSPSGACGRICQPY